MSIGGVVALGASIFTLGVLVFALGLAAWDAWKHRNDPYDGDDDDS